MTFKIFLVNTKKYSILDTFVSIRNDSIRTNQSCDTRYRKERNWYRIESGQSECKLILCLMLLQFFFTSQFIQNSSLNTCNSKVIVIITDFIKEDRFTTFKLNSIGYAIYLHNDNIIGLPNKSIERYMLICINVFVYAFLDKNIKRT